MLFVCLLLVRFAWASGRVLGGSSTQAMCALCAPLRSQCTGFHSSYYIVEESEE